MKRKSIICMATSLVMLLSSFTISFATDTNTVSFSDVPSDYWAKDQIEYFAQEGIVSGYEDGTFKPEEGVTREEFCKLLVATFNQPLQTPSTPTFSDVDVDRWSYSYVEVCSDFLTGYANPFGGLPSFHPAECATREDIAVALVRMMGFTDSDATNKNYALTKFDDGSSISPSLLPYVSIACERGLINGYGDGTFAPLQGITRAETVAMLNRATKQALTNINAELDLSAGITYSDDGKTATIDILAEEGTSVTINGETVKMHSNSNSQYEGSYVYNFTEEGSKDFIIEGSRSGKTKSLTVTATYEIGAPELVITSCPTSVSSKEITIKGTIYDKDYSTTLNINGESVAYTSYPDERESWEESFTLKEGENTFEFVLTNSAGKSTTVTKTVTFNIDGPELFITSCPTNVKTERVTISGTMYDKNYVTALNINGESVASNTSVDDIKSWSKSFTLKEGENTFEIVLTNSAGKTTSETRTITLTSDGPELVITSCPTNVTTNRVLISGTMYDKNYNITSMTVNGESLPFFGSRSNYRNTWSVARTLEEGENVIEITLTNAAGKSTTVTKTITLTSEGPELVIKDCPTSTTSNQVTISGTTYDRNYTNSLTINGESVFYNNGINTKQSWSKSYTLKEGENTFVFVATNSAGKSTTQTRTINFTSGGPELVITSCPTSTTSNQVTISGTMYDKNYTTSLNINGESVDSTSSADYKKSWSKSYTLKEGENTFEFVLTNSDGKTTTEKRTINFTSGGPELVITSCPTNVTSNKITISGTMYDKNYTTSLNVNGQSIDFTSSPDYKKKWNVSCTLVEGENTIEFVLTNSAGKTTTETRTVTLTSSAPELVITSCPTSVKSDRVTISGTMYDKNYTAELTINGESVASTSSADYKKTWSKSYTLKEGENTFEFVLTDSAGKTTTQTKTINYSINAPELVITNCPTNVTDSLVTLSGTMYDSTYSCSLTINGVLYNTVYYPDSKRQWSGSFRLKEGENTFEIVLTNSAGKTTTETRTINLTIGTPEIKLTSCPETTTEPFVYINGTVTGNVDGVAFYIDGKKFSLNANNEFSDCYILKEGENTVVFRAVNKYGKEVTVSKVITYTPED